MTAPTFNRKSRPDWLAYTLHRGYHVGLGGMATDRPALVLIVEVEDELADIEVEIRIDCRRLGPLTGPQWRQVVARELWEARRTARRLRNLQRMPAPRLTCDTCCERAIPPARVCPACADGGQRAE